MSEIQILAAFLITVLLGLYVAAVLALRKPPKRPEVNHIFLDLETLGIQQNAPILVIAAYAVDSLGNMTARDCWRINPDNAKLYGVADPATVQWWSEQSDYARDQAFTAGPRMSLPDALDALTAFIKGLNAPLIWGNAPTFDCAILRHAYGATGRDVPWEFWQERDVRTVAWVGEAIGYDAKKGTEFKGEKHVALDDARHQARYTIDILNYLGA